MYQPCNWCGKPGDGYSDRPCVSRSGYHNYDSKFDGWFPSDTHPATVQKAKDERAKYEAWLQSQAKTKQS